MHRAARSATADHVRALLQQLLFVHRAKLLATRLQYQLEETMDDLDDIGLDEQVLSGVLRTAHLEISGFIARCDQTYCVFWYDEVPSSTVQIEVFDLCAMSANLPPRNSQCSLNVLEEKGCPVQPLLAI